MSEGYLSWEQREAAAQLTWAKAAKARVEADSAKQKAATDAMAEKVRRARLAKQLEAVEQDAAEDKQQRRQQRRQARADSGSRFKTLVTVIIVLGMAASLPGQVAYFLLLGGLMLLPIPPFLELLAWAGVEGTQWAHRKGLPRWPFWLLTAGLAGFNGYINATHGAAVYGPVAGYVLAAASVVGPVLAEVRQFLDSRSAADGRSFEQRAVERVEARRKAVTQREQAKKDAAQDQERQRFFPETWERYEEILALHPEGSISRDEAWADATRSIFFPEVWKVYVQLLIAKPGAASEGPRLWDRAWRHAHQLPTGLTSDTLAGEIAAQKRIEEVLRAADRTPEQLAVDMLLADIFGPDGDDGGPAGGASGGGPKQGPGGGSKGPRATVSKGGNSLGRKGKQASGRTAPKTPQKPLEEADLEKVRKLADALGGAGRLSARNVGEVIGGGATEYLVRLRNAVQAEWKDQA